ncbi:uncharacterized protein LOC119729368 [Patiria miniata]|uniref:Uncharacterized protein n=1 Tax=Patiria miniata TaxID=46514 RepID=A0A914A255_PATMI|nr:uncharacterized protein LOC119729368 [Patiria miniata]
MVKWERSKTVVLRSSAVGCINISCQHIDLLHASPYIYPVPVLMKQLSQPITLFRFGACNSALSPVSLLQGRLIQRLMYLVSYRDKIREHDSTIVQQWLRIHHPLTY